MTQITTNFVTLNNTHLFSQFSAGEESEHGLAGSSVQDTTFVKVLAGLGSALRTDTSSKLMWLLAELNSLHL